MKVVLFLVSFFSVSVMYGAGAKEDTITIPAGRVVRNKDGSLHVVHTAMTIGPSHPLYAGWKRQNERADEFFAVTCAQIAQNLVAEEKLKRDFLDGDSPVCQQVEHTEAKK